MLRGKLDHADRTLIEGWAQDTGDPETPVRVSVTAGNAVLATVLADRYRADLAEGGIGSGRHSFSIVPGPDLPPGPITLRVRHAGDGADLPGSPVLLPAVDCGDADPLQGAIDVLDRTGVSGWARGTLRPDQPVSLIITQDDRLVARVLANAHRADLAAASLGTGRHAFSVRLAISPLQPCVVRVQREADGADLPGSPWRIEAATRFDPALRDQLAALLGDAESDADVALRLAFLAEQAERLQQDRADRHGNRVEREALRQVKWRGPGAASPDRAARRALVIDDRMPVPDRDAGSHAVLSHMQSLQRLGFEVGFAASDMGAAGAAALGALGIAAYHAPWAGSVEEVLRRQAGCFDLVYVHRLVNARYIPFIRLHQPRARLLFSVADLSHLRVGRQAAIEERPELAQHSRRLRAAEFGAAQAADAVITHSSYEAALLQTELPLGRVHVVPWAVTPTPTPVPVADRSGLAFIGGYDHAPNVDAALVLVTEIMPLVWQTAPGMRCSLVGAQMPECLHALAGPNVAAVGYVPDLAAVFGAVRLTAAPLMFGAGVKGKVLDSLAAGVPCVTSPIAQEGLPWPAVLARQGGATPPAMADAILRLHDDPALNAAVAEAGLAYIAAAHSTGAVDSALRPAAFGPAVTA